MATGNPKYDPVIKKPAQYIAFSGYLIGQPTGLTAFIRLLGRHNPRCRRFIISSLP